MDTGLFSALLFGRDVCETREALNRFQTPVRYYLLYLLLLLLLLLHTLPIFLILSKSLSLFLSLLLAAWAVFAKARLVLSLRVDALRFGHFVFRVAPDVGVRIIGNRRLRVRWLHGERARRRRRRARDNFSSLLLFLLLLRLFV
jgi:hypothetical protein